MKANFDRIAPWYDSLVQVFFGDRIRRAQIRLLDALDAPRSMLVIGGGTGWIIEAVASRFPQVKLVYVDSSAVMIRLARRRADHIGANVDFRLGTQETICGEERFDAILTPFFLDLFTEDEIKGVCDRLDQVLEKGGKWLISDFCLPNGWRRPAAWLLIRGMYLFFGMISNVGATKLPDYQIYFSPERYQLLFTDYLAGGMIESKIFLKS